MPPRRISRPKSPCSAQTRRLPKYKLVARDLPAGSSETLPRHRYQVHPGGDKRPCRVVGEDAEGRTTCYNAKAHSHRRKTCHLLVDPDNPLHDFEPGLYLAGGRRLKDETLVCTAWDIIMYDSKDVDTRTSPLPDERIVVLGPYVHPVTGLLTIKCILFSAFENVQSIDDFGRVFQLPEMSERGVMVPAPEMIDDFVKKDLSYATVGTDEDMHLLMRVSSMLTGIVLDGLEETDNYLETLDLYASAHPEFERKVRLICKCFYEMSLYFRRYAGPGRKIPLDLLDGVGSPSNRLSDSLRGKYVTSTLSGVRVTSTGSGQSQAADFVMEPEGTLTNMSQAYANTILMIYDSLPQREQEILRDTFELGTPYRIINGNGRFYLSSHDPNIYNGNPSGYELNLFDMCFGTGSAWNARGFRAVASVHGTRTYCVQIAAIQIIRSVQTILPYLYKSRPAWALVDGEFDNVHT